MTSANLSADVYWEVLRHNSAYITKRGHGTSTVIFSKEPMNLTNKHTRKQSGCVNSKAVGIQPASPRGVTVITKAPKHAGAPIQEFQKINLTKTNRKVYKSVASIVAKNGYRPDLRADAVARASAILYSQRNKKEKPAAKPRGKKAKKAEEEA